jgi:glutathione S-transferase
MNSKYNLYYFPGNGRASLIRAVLHYGGAQWEDKKVHGEEFAKLQKEHLEYHCVPALEIDGKWHTQTIACEILVAKKFNLLGETDEDLYEILNLLGSRDDISRPFIQWVFEADTVKKDAILKDLRESEIPFYLSVWEKKFEKKPEGKYWLGEKFSLADIFFACIFGQFFQISSTKKIGLDSLTTEFAPKLTAYVETIKTGELDSFFKNVFLHEGSF